MQAYKCMSNKEKTDNIFCEVFNVETIVLGVDFSRDAVECWDSVRQLTLAVGLEKAFDILLDPEDIMRCTSYQGALEIITKYGIEL